MASQVPSGRGRTESILAETVVAAAQKGGSLSERARTEVATIEETTENTAEAARRMDRVVEKFASLSRELKEAIDRFQTT